MIDIVQHLRDKGRRLVVAPPDASGISLVYVVTPAHSPELAGLPALDVSRAQRSHEEREHLKQRLDACKSDTERQRVQAEVDEVSTRMQKELNEELWGTPERQAAYLRRCRATVCAAVVAAGVARDDAPRGPQPMGTRPEAVCEVLAEPEGQEPVYLQPLRIVAERKPAPEAGTVCVLDYGDDEVMALQMLFTAAFSVQASVSLLPARSGADDLGASDGGDVRAAPQRVPARPGPGGGGAGRTGRAPRKGR
jgi:hypothetical protein